MKLNKAVFSFLFLSLCSCKQDCPAPVAAETTKSEKTSKTATIAMDSTATYAFIAGHVPYALPQYSEMFIAQWTHGGDYAMHRGVIKIDVSAISATAIIDSAFITLHGTDNATSPNISPGQLNNYGENSLYLEKVIETWTPSSTTWTAQPASIAADRVLITSVGNGNDDVGRIPITAFVADWVANPCQNYGMKILLKDEKKESLRRVILASPFHPMKHLRPQVEVYYRE